MNEEFESWAEKEIGKCACELSYTLQDIKSAFQAGKQSYPPEIVELIEAARELLPEWQAWVDENGKLEDHGYYLWNTKKFYNFADAVKALEQIKE